MASYARLISKASLNKNSTYGGYRQRMWGLMFMADMIGLLLTIMLSHFLSGTKFNFEFFSPGEVEHTLYLALTILLFIFSRLYPGIGINPAEEIKLVVRFSVTVFLITSITIFSLRPGETGGFFTLLSILAISIMTILAMRWSVRIIATKLGIWGEPVVVLAHDQQIDYLTRYFITRSRLGFIPVLAVSDQPEKKENSNLVPIINLSELLSNPLKDVETILVDASFFGKTLGGNHYHELTDMFKHVIFVSDMSWLEGASLAVRDFEGLTGIEANNGQLSPTNSTIKRGMDILGSALALLLFSPFLLFIMVLIKMDSPGPVFYTQERISLNRRKKERNGKHAHKVFIYKFRSMYVNADKTLAEYLASNPQAQLEWDQNQKLRDDPRITRIGKWLRKFSIDEIPQVLNVLRGDMSLVGPRPLPSYHHELLSNNANLLRDSVKPGITGLWQVSGRSNIGVSEMERLDSHYVQNWSPWLDIYIILRTVWVVLSRDGAY